MKNKDRESKLKKMIYEEIKILHNDLCKYSKTKLDLTYRNLEIADRLIKLHKLLN